MKILVTGGAGFIASHIVDNYLEADHQVEVIDDMSRGRVENMRDDVVYHSVDIRSNEVAEIFKSGKFDVVNHHAAQMDVRKSVEDPVFDADVNILGSVNLLQNCVKHGVGQFIFASTGGAIYGEQEEYPAGEEHPTRPVSPYGVAKLSIEHYLHYYHVEHGLDYSILRYANVYGPRQNPYGEAGVIAIFASKLLSGEEVVINGDGKQTRDYVFVDDIARLNTLVLGVKGTYVLNAGRGGEDDVNRLYSILKELTGSTSEARHGPSVAGEQRRSSIKALKAKELFNWEATIDLEEGLAKTVKYFKDSKLREEQ